jgi:hypothetical protein
VNPLTKARLISVAIVACLLVYYLSAFVLPLVMSDGSD